MAGPWWVMGLGRILPSPSSLTDSFSPHGVFPMLDQSTQFLTEAESAQVDAALLSSPEKFLARLTISTAKLLGIISIDLGIPLASLSATHILQWFEADAQRKREQGIEAAVLKWDADDLA